MPLRDETVAKINRVIQASFFTVQNHHEWTASDHETLQDAFKSVEEDVQQPTRPVGWVSSRRRMSLRAHRHGGRRA